MSETDLRYPIGRFVRPAEITEATRAGWIEEIAAAPERMREAVAGLDDGQLDTPYRTGGWTVRQVVHHLPDSHLNAYVRCKLALTEEEPAIRTYEEARWAELPEAKTAPVAVSLALLASLHERWVLCLRQLPPAAFARTCTHPQWGRITLDLLLGMYAWHGRHHVTHVTALRERMGWNGA